MKDKMLIKQIVIGTIFTIVLTNITHALDYCPPVTAIKCSDYVNCQLTSQYKNWQITNENLLESQFLTTFNSATLYNTNGPDGTFGLVDCSYSGPEHVNATLRIYTSKKGKFFYPAKSSKWIYTEAPNFKSFYSCATSNLKSCGFSEAKSK